MNDRINTPSTEQRRFARAIIMGHFWNILIGIIIFSVAHFLLNYTAIQSMVVTIAGVIIGGLITSYFAARYISKPVDELDIQLSKLNEKISASTTALNTANEEMQSLLNSLPLGILIFDNKLQLVNSNAMAKRILLEQHDNENDEITTNIDPLTRLARLVSNDNTQVNIEEWYRQNKKNKIKATKKWSMVVAENNGETVAGDIIAHYNKDDSFNHDVIVLLIDRTDEYEVKEREMEFISLAAHELRGPVTVLKGMVDVLQHELDRKITKDEKELLNRMAVSGRQLSGYIDNILGASRVDKDAFVVHREKGNWQQILQHSTKDLAVRAKANKRTLNLEIPEDLPDIAVDVNAITHVINNLIDNAIKYSREDGVIIVRAKLDGEAVETTIHDSGVGIPSNVMGHLFTKFYRSHSSKQNVSGTGLGLYLCKAIIEAHGGNIWVRSSEGIGTTFGFTIPTYASVSEQLNSNETQEKGIIRTGHGWIKNHSMFRR